MMKPKIIVLTTGGTIGHSSGKDGVAVMNFDPGRLVGAIGRLDLDIEFASILHKGSMDIDPDDWVAIARAVADAVSRAPRGIVILHGTDTMHYTAAALSFMLHDLGVPVVMTGSMIPGGDDGSDALANLRDAVVVAAQADFAEVCIVFSADAPRTRGVIIRGNRARKVDSRAINAFASINVPPIGTIADGVIARSSLAVRPRSSSQPSLATAIDRNVVLIKLTPNLEPDTLARLLEGASGAVLEGTGAGHIKSSLQPVVTAFTAPAVITTQTVYGGEHLGRYDIDRKILAIANIIPVGDMTSETALVKLMCALAQGDDVRSMMRTSLAGEICDLTGSTLKHH
jgi:L-asparaginase type I